MTQTTAPTQAAAPPPPTPTTGKRSPAATIPDILPLDLGVGPEDGPDRIVIYGTGGIGKSTLAAYLPAPLFLDVEAGSKKLNVAYDREMRATPTWPMLRGKLAAIAAAPPQGVKTIVIDTCTVAEELAKEHVIATRKTDKGKRVDSIEGFGWGKGWQFVYDEFNGLLADLDRIVLHGLNVCLIAHVVSSPAPNPHGEDFLRWEPLMYSGDKKGRGSIRERIKNWSEHVLFIGYDVHVQDGKGQGSGIRTIYTQEAPTQIAKSRTKQLQCPYDLQDPSAIWRELGILL